MSLFLCGDECIKTAIEMAEHNKCRLAIHFKPAAEQAPEVHRADILRGQGGGLFSSAPSYSSIHLLRPCASIEIWN